MTSPQSDPSPPSEPPPPCAEPARFQAEVRAHSESCPWPEMPEPVETPDG